MTATAYDRLLDRLRGQGKTVRANGTKAMAQCPAHEDHKPSLSITRIEGEVLVYCHFGCPIDAVVDALGITKSDLYDEPRSISYAYEVAPGQIQRIAHRTPEKKFWQSGDTQSQPILYRLPKVAEAVTAGQTIYLAEGEKDVHALESIGLVATTAPMGADNFHKVDVSPLTGATIIAIADRDDAGQKWAQQVREALEDKTSLEFRQAKVGKDAADHIAAGHTLDDFEPAEIEDPNAVVRRTLPRIDWHALWADEEAEEYISYPLVPRRRLIAIYSPPKIGKSLLMLEVAAAISRGRTVLGHTPTRRWRVLYVDFENDPRSDIRTRLQDMGYEPDDLDHLDYLSFPSLSALDSERGGWELLAAVKAYGSEFVVIDTISRAVAGEENSNDTWLDFYRHTGLKLKQAGVALLRIDHSGKDEAKGQRGGSAKSGDVDAVWRLTRVTDEHFRLECTDKRFQLDTKSLNLVRLADPLRHEVEDTSATTVRETKIAHIVKEADAAGLPADTSRRDLQAWGKERGIKARNDVWTEAARQRTLMNPENLLVPSQETSAASENPEKWSPDLGDHDSETPDSEREKWSPDPRGPLGTTNRGDLVPVPTTASGDQGTNGIKPPSDGQRTHCACGNELRPHLQDRGTCGPCHFKTAGGVK